MNSFKFKEKSPSLSKLCINFLSLISSKATFSEERKDLKSFKLRKDFKFLSKYVKRDNGVNSGIEDKEERKDSISVSYVLIVLKYDKKVLSHGYA